MMRRGRVRAAVAALLCCGVITAAPAAAEVDPVVSTFPITTASMTCATTQVGAAGLGSHEGSWGAKKPTGSRQNGDGCSQVDIGGLTSTEGVGPNDFDATWTGVVHGNLESMTVRGFLSVAGPGQALPMVGLTLGLVVDGEVITRTSDLSYLMTLTPKPSSTGVSAVSFSIAGLTHFCPLEPGDGMAEHQVSLTLHSHYADFGPAIVWHYGAADVPAGVTFNAERLEAVVVDV